MLLCIRSAASGTVVWHAPTGTNMLLYIMSGTDLGYVATRSASCRALAALAIGKLSLDER